MAGKKKKVTFSLPVKLLNQYKEYAAEKDIPSVTAGVQAAMEEYSKGIEREKLRREMLEAANDTLFMRDLKETMHAFEAVDRATAEEISEW